MTSGIPFSLSDIAKGGEPRNRENILLFSVASVIGQNYVDDINGGATPLEARQTALNDYHTQFNAAYLSAFGESIPNSQYGCVTMTENLAFRTVHDFLPGKIRMDTVFKAIPADNSNPLLNLSSKTPTKSGMNMYGRKFVKPIIPNSKYDAPITSLAKTGTIGLCIP